MWMWYHTQIQDRVLFKNWHVNDVPTLLMTCALMIVFGILFEFVRFSKWYIEQNPNIKTDTSSFFRHVGSPKNLILTAIYGIQVVIANLLMLAAMTFSVWIVGAISLGISIGYFFFGARRVKS